MPPDRVFIVAGEIEAFGGAERSIIALSRFLYQRGVHNRVVTYRDAIGLARHAEHPLEVVMLLPEGGGVRRKLGVLRKYLSSNSGSVLASGYQAALHATLAGQRGFHTLMHDTASLFSDAASRGWKGRLRTAVSNAALRYGLNSGGTTIVTSGFLQQECWRDFHVRAAIARMGGAPLTAFRERAVEGNRLHLLSVSRVESNKRLDWIVNALATLERRSPPLSSRVDWHLNVVGKGSQINAIQQLVRDTGLAERISLTGFVTDAQLEALFADAHLFLMPAVQGYGIPAVEALAAGIPVLLHRDSGVSDILLESPWATVAYGGPQQMTEALRVAVDKVSRGNQLGHPLPFLETEEGWAARVAMLCGWRLPA